MLKTRKILVVLLALVFLFACIGCSRGEEPKPIRYEQISQAEAKALMDSESDMDMLIMEECICSEVFRNLFY